MKISFDQYVENVEKILLDNGLDKEQSFVIADYMATVDFYGIKSHGVSVLDAHLKKIKKGHYNLTPKFTTEKESSSFAVINGDNAIGMISGDYCVKYAIKRAAKSGIFTVLSHNNNTYGSAFYYVLKAAEQGYICFTACNSPAQMAPFGGIQKMIGTNPFAVSVPALKGHPLIIDMATSVMAKSKIKEYYERGEKIPEGVALDRNGDKTDDPVEALNGLMLPMAGFKGYGISLMIDILSGLLSGAAFLDSVGRFYGENDNSMNVGYIFTLISPKAVFGEDFYKKVDDYIARIRTSEKKGIGEIILPGDDRINIFKENLEKGLEWTISL